MDDPNGENLDPVNSIISIPIIARKEFDKPNPTPKGVIVSINKIGGGDFSIEDISNVKAYNSLVAKVIEVVA